MNQLNPLHIGALLLVLLAFSCFKLQEVKKELLEIKHSYHESEKVALDLNKLKSIYANKQKIKHTLEKILAYNSLKKAHLQISKNKTTIKITTDSIEYKMLNFLMGKILNAHYNITKLKIKKLTDTTASLYMEIQW
jgi:predicted RNA-binding protein Jag